MGRVRLDAQIPGRVLSAEVQDLDVIRAEGVDLAGQRDPRCGRGRIPSWTRSESPDPPVVLGRPAWAEVPRLCVPAARVSSPETAL